MSIVIEPGTHISRAATDATRKARRTGKVIRFKFNDVRLFAAPKKSEITILWEFEQDTTRAVSNWRESKAGRLAELNRNNQIIERQKIVDALLEQFDGVAQMGLDHVVTWCARLASAADDICVQLDTERTAALLESAGYKDSAHVGDQIVCQTNRKICGEYIIGQAINCLRHGLSPHPITVDWLEKFSAMNAEGA